MPSFRTTAPAETTAPPVWRDRTRAHVFIDPTAGTPPLPVGFAGRSKSAPGAAGDRPHLVGTICVTREGAYQFAYHTDWLAAGFPLNPVHLPLTRGGAVAGAFHGVLADALPTEWGRRVHAAVHSDAPRTPIEWALATSGHGAGALTFSIARTAPSHPVAPPPDWSSVADVAAAIALVDQGAPLRAPHHDPLRRALMPGASLGGARPKAVVRYNGIDHIIKFARATDAIDHARAEHATLELARRAGITTVRTVLETLPDGRAVLLVRRFDRTDGGGRLHYVSAHSLLGIERTHPGAAPDLSYQGIARRVRQVADDPRSACAELYRRMVFNVLCGHTDDCAHSHALVRDPTKGYRLAPAFGCVPRWSTTPAPSQAIGVGEHGRAASVANALSQPEVFGLSPCQARAIVQEVADVLAHPDEAFDAAGLARADRRVVAALFQRHQGDAFTPPIRRSRP